MGTRATIRIVDADEERWLYGYPDKPGKDVSTKLDWLDPWTINTVADVLTSDVAYEPYDGRRGDEEYAYLIDCPNKTLTCYKIGANEVEWKNIAFVRRFDNREKTVYLKDLLRCDYDNNDMSEGKPLITCLGPFCDKPCKLKRGDFTSFTKDGDVTAIFGAFNFLIKKYNKLL